MTSLVGHSLGRYHLLEQLGEGGMAIVYKAYDSRLDRHVAIKFIRRDAFAPNQLEHILKRFDREAKALARLSHPNIVGVIDYGEYEGAPYLVMEYLPGGTLKGRLGKPIPWQDALRTLLPVSEALGYAHEHNIIHRDIKPSNILMTEKGQPMLTDFGIAKILETEEIVTLTGSGVGVGTPEYMAPEQWTGKTTLQSDIYSLGVVFYEMVTGRKPYVADTPAAILLKQATDPLPRPTAYVPDLPEGVERILLKALAKNARDRYADMPALIGALEGLLAGKSADKSAAGTRAQELTGSRLPYTATFDERTGGKTTKTVAELDASSTRVPTRTPVASSTPRLLMIGVPLVVIVVCATAAALILSNRPSTVETLAPPVTFEPNTPESTAVPGTVSATNTRYPAPTLSPSVPASQVPTLPPGPARPSYTANQPMYCRDLPSGTADTHFDFKAGAVFPVLGKLDTGDGTWILLDVDPPLSLTRTDCCWVASGLGTLSVDPDQIQPVPFVPDRLDCSALK
jgi:serine/threonine protein kinase